ncbi:MAG: glycosyltransferase family 87 protein [Rubrobacteraceae bacterium]
MFDALLAVAVIGVFALSFGLNVAYVDVALGRISSDSMEIHADFDSFWRSARAFWDGDNLYGTGAMFANLNPPLWTLMISPLGLLDTLLAYRVFTVLTVAVVICYLAWMADETKLRGGWAVVATGLLLVSSPLLATLALGQIYAFLTLGLVAAWTFDRRGMPIASGVALGLTIAVKPSLLPLALWPLVRKRWNALISTLVTGAVATLVAAFVVGFGATFEWVGILLGSSVSPYWDNASIPSAAARLFTENEYVEAIASVPWLVPVAYLVGLALVALTAWKLRDDPSLGFWALVAVSLLASPISWHNYLMLLAPGILLLVSRGKYLLALLLLALQTIPAQWPILWMNEETILASLMLTLYLYILFLHWVALLPGGKPGSAEGCRPPRLFFPPSWTKLRKIGQRKDKRWEPRSASASWTRYRFWTMFRTRSSRRFRKPSGREARRRATSSTGPGSAPRCIPP